MTIWRYRGYSHTANEVNLTRMDSRYRLSPRGRRESKIITLYLRGELQETGTALLAKIDELNNAYRLDYGDGALYTDAGVETPHSIKNNSACMTGVKIVHRSFPQGDGAELATKRTFSITLQAEYIDADDNLLEWNEKLVYIGDGGPREECVETFDGPLKYVTALSTAQRILQIGRAVGLTAYPAPPGPIFGVGTEHRDRTRIWPTGGRQRGLFATHFGMNWVYQFTTGTPQSALPSTI